MEHRFKAGQPVMVEEYLGAMPEIQSEGSSVDELILEEYQLRRRRGETPPFSEYRQRFPQHDIDRVLGSDPDVTQPLSSGTKPKISPSDLAPPEVIGRYVVRREIGTGAFGRVYQCFDAQLHREVAIKLSHPGNQLSGCQIQDYLHEARGAARLHHPGIVSVLDTGELEDGRGYVVYEYVAGQTLRQRFFEGYYTRNEAIRWCIELAEALHHAHTHEVVHRDVTPSNVLIDKEGHARLTDFGLARVADRFYRDDSGRMVGTLAYMSPEAALGDSSWASSQSDIYSLSVILYELLTRRRPFDSGCCGMQELRDQIVRRIPQPPRTIDETISKELERVCLRAMAKSPADRYTTAADLADALREAVTPQPKPQKSPWRFRWLGAAAAALLLFTMAGLVAPRIMNGVGSVTQIDEPQVKLSLLRVEEPEPIVLTDGDDESWDLPIRDEDGLRLNVKLNTPGYAYVLFVPEHGPSEMIYPRNAELMSPEKVTDLWCPEDPRDNELGVKPDEEYDLEMLLVVVTDTVLDADGLAALQALPFRPTDDVRRACQFRVLQVPVPEDAEQVVTRGLEERPIVERYLEGFAPAVKQLPIRCWRATIYRHARK
jgi:serine/threonine protein kinase